MPDGNGTGRLDRIEANLERVTERMNELTERMNKLTEKFHLMVDHHDAEFKQLMTWQVLMQDKMDRFDERLNRMASAQEAEQKRLNTLSENTDKRIADLVGAITKLIERVPMVSAAGIEPAT
jgi:uncharacterized phage infection (PIP) family protein YhgE